MREIPEFFLCSGLPGEPPVAERWAVFVWFWERVWESHYYSYHFKNVIIHRKQKHSTLRGRAARESYLCPVLDTLFKLKGKYQSLLQFFIKLGFQRSNMIIIYFVLFHHTSVNEILCGSVLKHLWHTHPSNIYSGKKSKRESEIHIKRTIKSAFY